MDGWGDDGWRDAEARTWLAMDLLTPVHELWALVPGRDASAAVQELADGLVGEHRPALTEVALAGLVDLERALVVGAALDAAAGLVEPHVLALVEDALVDEACRLPLLPLVNAAADLLLELEREAVPHAEADAGLRFSEPDGDTPTGMVTARERSTWPCPVRPSPRCRAGVGAVGRSEIGAGRTCAWRGASSTRGAGGEGARVSSVPTRALHPCVAIRPVRRASRRRTGMDRRERSRGPPAVFTALPR